MYRDPMTFGSAPGLHLHAPHDDGLHEYWPHEQDFLLKISRYFEGREDLRDGFLIPSFQYLPYSTLLSLISFLPSLILYKYLRVSPTFLPKF